MITTRDSTLFNNVNEAVATAIDALGHVHNNICHITRKYAIRASAEGRAAFWSTSQYHDQKARNFLDECNDLGALIAITTRVKHHGTETTNNPHRLINTLIPLNPKARDEIELARKAVGNDYANVKVF